MSNLYEKVLTSGAVASVRTKVKASASVVLWRRNPAGKLQVYWVHRAPTMKFMGGWHAFPGGGVNRLDAQFDEGRIVGRPQHFDPGATTGAMPAGLTDGVTGESGQLPPDQIAGLIVATLRELFEETGLLPVHGDLPDADHIASARVRLLSKETTFDQAIAELDVVLDAGRLMFAGRWLTPPLGPVRFDNRFFTLEWSKAFGDAEPTISEEAVTGEWIQPSEAIERWQRGEVIAAPPILHILEVFAQELANPSDNGDRSETPMNSAASQRLIQPTEANLGPYRKVEFRPGVLMFPLPTFTLPPADQTNAYVVGFGRAVLVDPGTTEDRAIGWLLEAIEAIDGQLGRRVEAICLTHHHPDHVGGVSAIREALGLPVWAHPATAERLEPQGISVDRLLEDGEVLDVSGEAGHAKMGLEVIHTPGHARGHLCFFDRDRGSMIAGDMISAVSTIVVDPPEGDMDDYLKSLERLAEVGPRTLFPGHGPAIPTAVAKLRSFISHRLWREEKIAEAWHAGRKQPREMLEEVYGDVPKPAWPLAERQILAHLERLERAGRLN